MPRARHTHFASSRGERLAAILDLPDSEPTGWVLFAHCFTCTKDVKAAYWIGQGLAQRGLAMLRFDFAGIGQSEGELAESGLSSNIDDLVAAADFLRSEHAPPKLLVGHSLGGVATLAAASRIPEARAVCTISSSFSADHLVRYLTPDGPPPDRFQVTIANRTLWLRRSFVEDLQRQDMAHHIANLGRPLLVMHSPEDRIVELAQAERIFAAASQPRSLIALDGADHLLSSRAQAARVAELIVAWARPYLG